MYSAKSVSTPKFYVHTNHYYSKFYINLDSGADVGLMSQEAFDRLCSSAETDFWVHSSNLKASGFAGSSVMLQKVVHIPLVFPKARPTGIEYPDMITTPPPVCQFSYLSNTFCGLSFELGGLTVLSSHSQPQCMLHCHFL